MKSPQALLRFLRKRREDATEKLAGNGELGVAVCEVLDELIRRAQVIANEYPTSSKISLRDIEEMPAVVGAMQALMNTVTALADLANECADATAARRDPVLKFVARVRAEGFEVANDWTLTDTIEQPQAHTDNPELLVQREAEKIARTEQAAAYHERLLRMAAEFEDTTTEYTRRVRSLIGTVLDG
ncbi:hypothetical protein [Mycobacteroides chelonae]|uniref:hypothetical protein n=1 Tax=Mycobacteroides chelonae TaxID=1774 RepID=UPI0008A9A279|nr:hypothetical protein [Mycobacteroides chelonae]OHU53462.1 hypothetical protein BKG81_06585 [Mycobacteroides chelonae]